MNNNSKEVFSALTSKYWTDRILGGNEMGLYHNRLVWIVSCNNIAGTDELVRRSIWIRLDAGVEQPDERRSFRHPDLHGFIKENRPRLLGAVMTLLRSWLEAGRPHYSGQLPPIGSFEAWTAVMGGLLEHLGLSGFLANRAALRSRADKETTAWNGFVDAWWEVHGSDPVTSAELMPLAGEWMGERLGEGKEQSQKIKLGRLLSSHLDRIYGGRKVQTAGLMTSGPSKGSASYRLWDVSTPPLTKPEPITKPVPTTLPGLTLIPEQERELGAAGGDEPGEAEDEADEIEADEMEADENAWEVI